MNWIKPKFEHDEFSLPATRKRPKILQETATPYPPLLSSGDWLKNHSPTKIDELGVSITKVEELKNWLIYAENKMLLLAGPSGCGKTTTLKTVSKKLGFKIKEWITPVDRFEDASHQLNIVKKFEEFIMKSSKYHSCLNFESPKTVILVKDFPSIFLKKPFIFHDVLENSFNMCLNNPIIFVCGDNAVRRKLFSSTLKIKIPVIWFNHISNLQMLRVLKLIINKERQVNPNFKVPSDQILFAICASSQGDIRHSMLELFFQCVEPSAKKNLIQSVDPEKTKDFHVDFFLGIGKVFSPKKEYRTPPENLIINFLGEAKDFVGRLNENLYKQFTNLYDVNEAARWLSISDIFMARWQENIFKEYSLSVAIQGLMVCNKHPQEPTFQRYCTQRTFNLEKTVKCSQLDGKLLFSDLCVLDNQCLSDYLYFAKYLMIGKLNSSQEEYLEKNVYL